MADNIDALLAEEGTAAQNSQSENQGQGQVGEVSKEINPEEAEFNKLSGTTQDRIRKLIRERNDAMTKAEQTMANQVPPPPPTYNKTDPGVQDVVNKLSDVGMATKKDVQQEINNSFAQLTYKYELDRLENKYNGGNGKPKFTREEYEDFTGRNKQYQSYLPEDVYNIMYREELFDWQTKNLNHSQRKSTQSLKPVRTISTSEGEMSVEDIEARLKESDGPQWYEKNVDKINKAVSQMSQSQEE